MAKIRLTMQDGTKIDSNEFQMYLPISVSVNSTSGTLTEDQLRILSNPNNGIVAFNSNILRCVKSDLSTNVYSAYPYGDDDTMVCIVNKSRGTYSLNVPPNIPVRHTIMFKAYTSSIAPFNFGFTLFSKRRTSYNISLLGTDGVKIPCTYVGGTYFTTFMFFDNGKAYVSGIKMNSATDFNELTQELTIEEFRDVVEV